MPQTGQELIPVSVSVTGDVIKPGVYTLTTMNRVSEALAMATMKVYPVDDLKQQLPIPARLNIAKINQPTQADTMKLTVFNKRNVVLVRQGQRQTLDLLKYLRLGDISQNPFLKDGDIIIVSPAHSTLTLDGAVSEPGEYEFKAGDTIKDMLDIALGTMENADLKHVMLFRYKNDWLDFDKTELDLSGYPEQTNTVISQLVQSGDRIIVPTNSEYRKAYKVTISGKIKRPGTYYINEKTSLYDLLVMSGGPTPEADMYSSYVYNKLISENYDPDFERLSSLSMLQMTWLEYSYLRTKTRQLKGKYSIDVQTCWNSKGDAVNLILKDGDEVIIPELINGVWVAGQVKHPGLITWKENMNWTDYLTQSGGFANNYKPQGIRIIRYGSGNWVKPNKDLKINPGDAIFVPDKQERYVWDNIREAILVTSQVLTIFIALKSINTF
jgi:protein involved in polysaccharide export with SLBB domain